MHDSRTLRLTETGMMMWDGNAINRTELVSNLQAGLLAPREPTIVFVPDANASYELTARVLTIVIGDGGRLPLNPDRTWQGEPLPVRDWKSL